MKTNMIEYYLSILDSLERVEKDADVYFLLTDNSFMNGDEIKKVYLICFGYPFEDSTQDLIRWFIKSGFKAKKYFCSNRIDVQTFLYMGDYNMAKEFCRKEYKDSDRALELLEKIIKEKEKIK